MKNVTDEACVHPSGRLHAWWAYDGTLCVGCCECGAVLAGAADGEPVGETVGETAGEPDEEADGIFYVQATMPSGRRMVEYRRGRENARRFYESLAPCPEKRWGRNGRDIESEGVVA